MTTVTLSSETDFDGWRTAARDLASRRTPSEMIIWSPPSGSGDLFDTPPAPKPPSAPSAPISAPARFIEMAKRVCAHRDPERFAILYRILLRLQDNRSLLDMATDPDIAWLRHRDQAIRRDIHKMHAFVRFRNAGVAEDGRECFVSWFEPTHRIAMLAAPFFQKRFTQMNWLIVTPDMSVAWDGAHLIEAAGGTRSDAPDEDAMEDGWRIYYASIFNPARMKVRTMQGQMPKKYWANLPEAQLIPRLISDSQGRCETMLESGVTPPSSYSLRIHERRPVADRAPVAPATLDDLRRSAVDCQRCTLHACASQTVFGSGPANASLMIVGEQPGDEEDIAGRPFVGPAGKVLNACMDEAGVDRQQAYLTNAVKHFKFTPRGKRRIHERPNAGEIDTCRWWLDQERALVQPRVVVSLGASAWRGLTGASAKLADVRSRPMRMDDGGVMIATVHPSYLLRLPDEAARVRERAHFIAGLRLASSLLNGNLARPAG